MIDGAATHGVDLPVDVFVLFGLLRFPGKVFVWGELWEGGLGSSHWDAGRFGVRIANPRVVFMAARYQASETLTPQKLDNLPFPYNRRKYR